VPPFTWGTESPSNTMSPGTRPTSVASGILILPAVWPQQTCAENWGGGCAPFGGAGFSSDTKCGLGRLEAYLPTKWHLDLSSRLATTDMGRKLGGAVPLCSRRAGSDRLTQCGLG